jgi:cytochrome P450
VRLDSLLEGQVTEDSLHESLVSSLFAPDSTNMADVAHFMRWLLRNPQVRDDWMCGLPGIINAASK